MNYAKYPNMSIRCRNAMTRIHNDLCLLFTEVRGTTGPVPDLDAGLFESVRRVLAECNASVPSAQRSPYSKVKDISVLTIYPGDVLIVNPSADGDPMLCTNIGQLKDNIQKAVGPNVKVLVTPAQFSVVRKQPKPKVQ